jgi:hypothetical protein
MPTAQATQSRDRVARRAACLSLGLAGLGVKPGDRVAILVCPDHEEDRLVGRRAVAHCNARPVCLAVEDPVSTLRAQLSSERGGVLLACEEGVAAWRATMVPMRVVADTPQTVWWRLLELRGRMPAGDLACRVAS